MKPSTISLLLVLGSINSAQALSVQIEVTHSYCGQYAGCATAVPSGGVPPYSYSWSTGETTQSIYDISSGPISVLVTDFVGTQASANATVGTQPWQYTLFTPAYCSTPVLALSEGTFLFTFEQCGDMIDVAKPININGYPGAAVPVGPPAEGTFTIHPLTGLQPGTSYALNSFDANGCPGILDVVVGWPVEFPEVTISNVSGSCTGVSIGAIQFSHTNEGHGQTTAVYLRNAVSGQVVQSQWLSGSAGSGSFTGLAAGSYWMRQNLHPFFSDLGVENLCGDSVLIDVPDLGACGVLSGGAYADNNENCIPNSGEAAVVGSIIEVLPGPYYTTTASNGTYSFVLPYGAYTVEQQSTVFQEHCTGGPIPFELSQAMPQATRNMPDSSLVAMDAMVSVASGLARPGFTFSYAMSVRNLTPTATGATTLTFIFDPTLSFISATPAPSNVSGNTITWNQTQLGAWQERNYSLLFQVPSDIGLLGNELVANATLATVVNDGDLSNNTATDSRTITAAYDPNDKLARTSLGSTSTWYLDDDEWIDYTIRFQNTGTDTAFNVVITDTLPPTLDPGSIIWGAASHTHTRMLEGQGILRFMFPNILLPDSNVNEPLSHGFVSFRIRPRLPLLPGDEITNTANIYFDYNPPVITEPSVLVVEFSTGVEQPGSATLQLRPNPATDQLFVTTEGTVERLQVHASDGRILLTGNGPWSSGELDISGLPSGAFILEVVMESGAIQRGRFIKP